LRSGRTVVGDHSWVCSCVRAHGTSPRARFAPYQSICSRWARQYAGAERCLIGKEKLQWSIAEKISTHKVPTSDPWGVVVCPDAADDTSCKTTASAKPKAKTGTRELDPRASRPSGPNGTWRTKRRLPSDTAMPGPLRMPGTPLSVRGPYIDHVVIVPVFANMLGGPRYLANRMALAAGHAPASRWTAICARPLRLPREKRGRRRAITLAR